MTLDLATLPDPPPLPPEYSLGLWDPSRLPEVARCDWLAYRGSLDARLYWQYFSTQAGCERMWREAIAGKFGRFDPARTLLLFHGGRVCGNVMASTRGPRDAFIGNLAVEPGHRGGTGSALLLECLARYRTAGFERVSLAVTLDNHRALALYSRLGFVISGRFPLLARPAGGLGP
jgi:ribosomal protein S18 acetylase RimI-like enzyme